MDIHTHKWMVYSLITQPATELGQGCKSPTLIVQSRTDTDTQTHTQTHFYCKSVWTGLYADTTKALPGLCKWSFSRAEILRYWLQPGSALSLHYVLPRYHHSMFLRHLQSTRVCGRSQLAIVTHQSSMYTKLLVYMYNLHLLGGWIGWRTQ